MWLDRINISPHRPLGDGSGAPHSKQAAFFLRRRITGIFRWRTSISRKQRSWRELALISEVWKRAQGMFLPRRGFRLSSGLEGLSSVMTRRRLIRWSWFCSLLLFRLKHEFVHAAKCIKIKNCLAMYNSASESCSIFIRDSLHAQNCNTVKTRSKNLIIKN